LIGLFVAAKVQLDESQMGTPNQPQPH